MLYPSLGITFITNDSLIQWMVPTVKVAVAVKDAEEYLMHPQAGKNRFLAA
jgi:hypothetical protein